MALLESTDKNTRTLRRRLRSFGVQGCLFGSTFLAVRSRTEAGSVNSEVTAEEPNGPGEFLDFRKQLPR